MIKEFKITENITILQSERALLNASIIENQTSLLVIDTFLFPNDSKYLVDFCKSLDKPVKYIINTHWHSDHCYGNRFFDLYNPTIITHENYWKTISSEKNMIRPDRESIVNKRHLRVPNITFKDTIRIDDFALKCSWVHGHSSDSIIIHHEKENILWTGDNVLNSNNNKIAIPYFFWGDINKQIQALKLIIDRQPQRIIPGHGNETTIDKVKDDLVYLEQLLNNFNSLKKTPEQIDNISASECYPNSSYKNFWVEEMHKLNIQNLKDGYLSSITH